LCSCVCDARPGLACGPAVAIIPRGVRMQVPLEIAFHGVAPSPWAEQEIRERVAHLERIYGRLVSCRVRVDKREKKHNDTIPPVVRIELGIPGKPDLVGTPEPEPLLPQLQAPALT